jgi:hypothetical protein
MRAVQCCMCIHRFAATMRDMPKELRRCRCRRVVRHDIPALVVSDGDVETCTRRRSIHIQEDAVQPLQHLIRQSCHILITTIELFPSTSSDIRVISSWC